MGVWVVRVCGCNCLSADRQLGTVHGAASTLWKRSSTAGLHPTATTTTTTTPGARCGRAPGRQAGTQAGCAPPQLAGGPGRLGGLLCLRPEASAPLHRRSVPPHPTPPCNPFPSPPKASGGRVGPDESEPTFSVRMAPLPSPTGSDLHSQAQRPQQQPARGNNSCVALGRRRGAGCSSRHACMDDPKAGSRRHTIHMLPHAYAAAQPMRAAGGAPRARVEQRRRMPRPVAFTPATRCIKPHLCGSTLVSTLRKKLQGAGQKARSRASGHGHGHEAG